MHTSSIQVETINSNKLHYSTSIANSTQPKRVIGRYFLSKTLGKGSMGKVKLALNTDTNEKVAVKIVSRKLTTPNTSRKQEISREIRTIREASIMLLLDHPHIAKMHEMVLLDDFYYLFMEYVDGGQLLDYIISHGRLKERHARHIARQIASALDYCHRNSIVHRDLKVENILISRGGNIKIIDFGLSNLFSPTSHLSTFCGSLYFAAPELLDGRMYTGPEVDIWSFGVVIYVLVTGQVPFDDPTMAGMHAKVKHGNVEYPSYLSTDCRHLLQRMLVTNREKRSTMSEIITHTWMNRGYSAIVDNHLPQRNPLELPIDMNVVQGMQGFEFGSQESIKAELEALINKGVSDQHPLISVYYLVMERMKRHSGEKIPQLASVDLEQSERSTKTVGVAYSAEGKSQVQASFSQPIAIKSPTTTHPNTDLLSPHSSSDSTGASSSKHRRSASDAGTKLSTPTNMLRRLSRRLSRHNAIMMQEEINSMKEQNADAAVKPVPAVRLNDDESALEAATPTKLDRFLKRATSITVKDLPSTHHHHHQRHKSVMNEQEIERQDEVISRNNHNDSIPCLQQADQSIRSVYVKGLFSVSTTSTKKPSLIRKEIVDALKTKGINYRETVDRFECYQNLIKFDIYIVKIPWLLGMRGVQFRRVSGDPWQYKNICSNILNALKL
ncbi:MAG: kinase-like domain-containing protein [Benjaminiella poitrasii]|nr:MAG: kinase-like domain-containing protein [Benjaminiella poitrasii]